MMTGGNEADRVGPYTVLEVLGAVGSGALLRARDPEGGTVLLQTDRARPAREGEDRARALKQLAVDTQAFLSELAIRAHGAADLADGSKLVFWAFPDAKVARLFAPRSEALARAAALAGVLAERHGRGLCAPTLSEPFVGIGDGGGPVFFGAPLAVPRVWSADPTRYAPEEEVATPAGDVFRLGRLLAEGLGGGAQPAGLERLLERMLASDPAARPSMREVAETLAGLDRPTAESTERIAFLEPAAARSPAPRTLPMPTGEPLPIPSAISGPPDTKPRSASSPELDSPWADAVGADPADGAVVGGNLLFAGTAELGSDEPEVTDPARPIPTLIVAVPAVVDDAPALPATEVGLRPLKAAPSAETAAARAAIEPDPSELNTSVQSTTPPSAAPAPVVAPVEASDALAVASPARRRPDSEARLGAARAAWAAPEYPEGASPWSAVVSPRGMFKRDRPDFGGFPDDALPELEEPTRRAPRESGPAAPLPKPLLADDEPSVGTRRLAFGRDRRPDARRIALGVVLILGIFGGLLWMGRPVRAPIPAMTSLTARPVNEVTVGSEPSGATVISERDGQLLGTTPLTFLVPPGANAAVLVVARGFEPQRLILPERGRIAAALIALPPDAGCRNPSQAPPGVEFETVLGAADPLPGRAVVRARPGQAAVGAAIVSCPSFGGSEPTRLALAPPPAPALVSVARPAGGWISVNGESLGAAPVRRRVASAFALVTLERSGHRPVSRWIPTTTDVEVEMPEPAVEVAPPAPVAVAPPAAVTPPPPAAVAPASAALTSAAPPTVERVRPARRADRALAHLRSGSRHLLAGRTGQAEVSLTACLRADPEAAACHRALGTLYRKSNSEEKAREHFERYLQLSPGASDAEIIRKILATLN